MRSGLLLLLLASCVAAQTPPVPTPPATGFESQPLLTPPPPPPPLPPGPVEVLTAPGLVADLPWQFDVLLGAPTALRLQHRIFESRVWWEVGVGGYLVFPTAFAGLRTEGRLIETRRHVVAVRPGLDIYYMGGYDEPPRPRRRYSFYDDELHVPAFGAIAFDIDFQWQARWSDRFESIAGLKLGCGGAFGQVSGAVPIAALFFGCNF